MKIVQFVNRRREDVAMYWKATRFLWHVFTHPKNPLSQQREDQSARAPERQASAMSPYRGYVVARSQERQSAHAQNQARQA